VLFARGHRQIGKASFRWAIVFAGAGFFQIIETDGITCDTRVFPAPAAPPKPIVCLELLVRGTFEGFGALTGRFSDRTALALRHEHYQGADGERSFAFRAEGRPLVMVEWHAPSSIVVPLRLPTTLSLDDATWDAATRAGRLSDSDDAAFEGGVRALIEQLARRDIVTQAGAARALRGPPAPFARLWRALKPTIEHLALSVTASDLGAGADLSTTQVERAFRRWATAFALVGPGLRSVTHLFRMNTAVLFLSAEDATVADVALATGYGSADAMARAFRDAGLAAPTVVQKQLRGM
jgi:AraC-like DNA-binding protein